MASGGKEHRMVFDIRGRRRHVVKVVYAILAVLMGLSLFLVTGAININTLLGSSSGESSNGAQIYEEQAQRVEHKLKKNPEDPELQLALMRARLNAGNQLVERTSEATIVTADTVTQYRKASEAWSNYLKATDEPAAGAAQLMTTPLVTLAESSRSASEAESNLVAAAEAQKIIAQQRPSPNSWSNLVFYSYLIGDKATAKEAEAEVLKPANSKVKRETLENKMTQYRKQGESVQKQLKEFEKANKGAGKEALEHPVGSLGGTTLGE